MDEFFLAKIDDLLSQSERGVIACSRFYDPAEQYAARQYLQKLHIAPDRYAFFGGYADAERAVLIALPEWCADVADAYDEALCAVEIQGSGFRDLAHPQYLGSLLSCGIERETVGDIVTLDAHHAVVFVTPAIKDYLLGQDKPLCRVASDTVTVAPFAVPQDFSAHRKIEMVTDTVASLRLDCVVAALLRTSRAKAQEALKEKRVRLNFAQTCEFDTVVAKGDQLSIRGAGRFRVIACEEKTKKERFRLTAEHFVP